MPRGKDQGMDAIKLLTEDHKRVQQMFKAFEKLQDGDGSEEDKAAIVALACAELTIHAQIEEEILYPAAREALEEDEDLLDEAEVEHASAKDLIAQLAEMQPGDALYDAKFTVLGEYVNHHIKEEQDEMFPKLKKSDVDLQALGEELMGRKQALMAEMGLQAEGEEEEMDEAEASSARPPGRERGSDSARKR
jgi:hemerythrin-like domain-containing protein